MAAVRWKCSVCGKSNNQLKKEGVFTTNGWALGHCKKCGQLFCLEHTFEHLAKGNCAEPEVIKALIEGLKEQIKEN